MSLRKPKVERDIQKRIFPIPPAKVDKQLIKELGEFLEKQEVTNLTMTYRLNSETKEVVKHKIKDFVNSDWGKDIREITINSKTMVRIIMNFMSPERSEYSVYGKDLTKVNGIAECIREIFQKKRLRYAPIKTRFFVALGLTSLLTGILSFSLFQIFNAFIMPNLSFFSEFVDFTISLFVLVIVIPLGIGLYIFIQWLFPYFEYGETRQKSVRKWIWFVLFGLGIVPTIIQRMLGL